jgi:hypothetical protein
MLTRPRRAARPSRLLRRSTGEVRSTGEGGADPGQRGENPAGSAGAVIWNPDHLDKNWQNSTYVSEHGTDMYVHVQTVS